VYLDEAPKQSATQVLNAALSPSGFLANISAHTVYTSNQSLGVYLKD